MKKGWNDGETETKEGKDVVPRRCALHVYCKSDARCVVLTSDKMVVPLEGSSLSFLLSLPLFLLPTS